MRDEKKQIHEWIKHLTTRIPCAFPVRFAGFLKPGQEISTADFTGKSYTLRVRPGLTKTELQDCLVHEWAHFRVWGMLQAQTYEHDAHWGIEYARAYREFYGSS